MLPLPRPVFDGYECTHDEHRTILEQRRATLDAAAKHWTQQESFPVAWRLGWSCTFKILGRDRENSLLVRLTARGDRPWMRFTRDVRLVRRGALPWSLRKGLRES